jgi:hypothetical protein
MVIVMLAAMLILSGAISIGTVQPVLAAFVLFAALYVVYLTGCILPGYARTRAASAIGGAPSRVPPTSARPAILGTRLPVSR